MARIRTIKPDFYKSAHTAKLSLEARLFFLQLLTEVDDEGRTRWLPKHLAGVLYPHDEEIDALDVYRWVEECEAVRDPDDASGRGMVARYQVGGVPYLAVVNFGRHQHISKPTASRLPPPPWPPQGLPAETPGDPAGPSEDPVESRGGSRKVEVGSRKVEVGETPVDVPPTLDLATTDSNPPPEPNDPLSFERFWKIYPRRNGLKLNKEPAALLWRKLALTDKQLALRYLENYAAACDQGLTIAADASTWLNKNRWRQWEHSAVPDNRRGAPPPIPDNEIVSAVFQKMGLT